MRNKTFIILVTALFAVTLLASASLAAEKETFGTRVKNFWKNILGYPARVTEESASVVADTAKNSASVVSNAVKRVGEVTTGDVAKTKELITEPITQTAETIVKTGEGTIKVPSESLKDKTEVVEQPAQSQNQ